MQLLLFGNTFCDIVVEVEEVLYKYTSVSLYEMRSIELQEICF